MDTTTVDVIIQGELAGFPEGVPFTFYQIVEQLPEFAERDVKRNVFHLLDSGRATLTTHFEFVFGAGTIR